MMLLQMSNQNGYNALEKVRREEQRETEDSEIIQIYDT